MRARHRTSKPLPRYGIVYSGGSAWTGVHTQWLQSSLPRGQLERASGAPTALAYHAGPDAVLDTTARRDRPGRAITETAADSEFTAVVRRLGCLRGVSDLTGLALAVEIGDRHRFTGRSIGSHVGLVPSEESSGQTRSQGSITKAGNKHVSRLLVEAAWRHRNPYRPGADLRRRWNRATPEAKNRGDRANQRLHHRWNAYEARHKKRVIANTAIARELAGFCRSLAVMDD